jgi:hypothetical protein
LKNQRKHLNKYLHNLLASIDFEISIISIIFCILIFSIIAFRKQKFGTITLVPFLNDLSIEEHKFET